MTAPKRRWPRFTLRTLFVVVTVFGVWLAWNVHQVHERERLAASIRSLGGVIHFTDGESPFNEPPEERTSVPFVWRILGAERAWWIERPPAFSDDDWERARGLFPEVHESIWRTGPPDVEPHQPLPRAR